MITLPGVSTTIPFVLPDGQVSPYGLGWLTKLVQLLSSTIGKGFTGTITTAKLTTLGANGSITFVNGVVTAQVAAT